MKTIQEKREEAVEIFKQEVLSLLTRRFNEDGYIVPVVFGLVVKDDKLAIGVLAGLEKFFISREEMINAPDAIKAFVDRIKPLAIAFATEAWVRIASATEKVDYSTPVSEHPDKIETLSVFFETFDKHSNKLYSIHEDVTKGNKSLRDFKNIDWTDKSKKLSKGRFVNILNENYSETCEELKEALRKNMN